MIDNRTSRGFTQRVVIRTWFATINPINDYSVSRVDDKNACPLHASSLELTRVLRTGVSAFQINDRRTRAL